MTGWRHVIAWNSDEASGALEWRREGDMCVGMRVAWMLGVPC